MINPAHKTNALRAEWLTPPELIEQLGPFDLDPAAPMVRPWDTAKEHFTLKDNGLARPWHGFVWLNPPFGNKAGAWLKRLADHGNGIALIFARTDTKTFFEHVWSSADALLFMRGRIHFHHPDGRRANNNSGAPTALVGYGSRAALTLLRCSDLGVYIAGWLRPNGEAA